MVFGISDITSSEGRLHRFTLICKVIGSEKGLTRKKAGHRIEKELGVPFINKKVIQRHLIILEKLGIIENRGGLYLLSSEGKALDAMVDELPLMNDLSFEERVFYFKIMFNSILKEQLIKFLEVIREQSYMERKKIVYQFFSTNLAQNLWNVTTIEKNLKKLGESRKIPTFFENKFRCMEMWLEDIGLIVREKNRLSLHEKGKIFLDEIGKLVDKSYEYYGLIGQIFVSNVTPFLYDKHRQIFVELFKKAYYRFRSELYTSDIRAIRIYTCINFLKRNIKLEEKEFDEVINTLSLEGIVRSVMLGRDGKPAYVTLSEIT